MNFILISKKESFQDKQINDDFLNSPDAPVLISREAVKFNISNFIIYIYPYDHIDPEVYDYSYYCDHDKFLLINGLVNISNSFCDNSIRNPDISKFFEQLNTSKLIGDYQLISIDKNGNGIIKTPLSSKKQLFIYEDENCTVLSTEIKLIVDGINKFRENPFIDHFDLDFIEDSAFKEWQARKVPQNTIFREIKRIFPQDIKYFKEGKIIIERKKSIEIPEWFRNAFNEDRNKLYDDYYKFLVNFAEINLVNLKPNIKKIIVGLTGGFDSRITAAILSKVCKKHQIPLLFYTSGQDTHPDVVIAKKIAGILDVEHFHHFSPNNYFPNNTEYNDYILTFYLAQGDWNSKDFVLYYDREMSSRLSPLIDNTVTTHAPGIYPVNESEIFQLGYDGYKRNAIYKVNMANRWSARRVLFNQNFIFPLLFTEYEVWFGLLYGEMKKDAFKEFVYEILKRSEHKLLDIPFVGDSLPQVEVEQYSEIMDSKHHNKEPFLWDFEHVNNNLKPLLSKKLDELNEDEKSFLKLVGINELDYFFNKKISKIIDSYRKKKINLNECFKGLLKERSPGKYPRTKTMIEMTKESDRYINKMQILMDFASVANKKSFQEIEKQTLKF